MKLMKQQQRVAMGGSGAGRRQMFLVAGLSVALMQGVTGASAEVDGQEQPEGEASTASDDDEDCRITDDCCPITHERLVDPVYVVGALCLHRYSRKAVDKWFNTKGKPKRIEPIPTTNGLIPVPPGEQVTFAETKEECEHETENLRKRVEATSEVISGHNDRDESIGHGKPKPDEDDNKMLKRKLEAVKGYEIPLK